MQIPDDTFLREIIDQPEYLRNALDGYPINAIENLIKQKQSGDFNKIVLTGHGASYNSLYPSFLKLNSGSISSTIWQTSELLHYGINQIDEKTLLVANSQSGQSAEIVTLVNNLSQKSPFALLALTNDPKSSLGLHSNILLPLNAGIEEGVATKTYMNALGMAVLFSSQLAGENINNALQQIRSACQSMQEYLSDWETMLKEVDEKIGKIQNTVIVGRGQSMATVWTAALNQKEAAQLFTEGMNAGEFRHGPLELTDANMTLIIYEGEPTSAQLNSKLALEVAAYGSHVLWIGNQPPEGIASLNIPVVAAIAQPMAEILPSQFITHVLASRQNLQAGKFRRIGKIVLKE